MWDSHYCIENQVRVFASLLRSDLNVEDNKMYLIAMQKTHCVKLIIGSIKFTFRVITNIDETLKLLDNISKYNEARYQNQYLGEMS